MNMYYFGSQEGGSRMILKAIGKAIVSSIRTGAQAQAANKNAQKARIAQLEQSGAAYCPKCYSTSLSANKKGFGIGKAVVGAAAFGAIGLVAGNVGAKKVRVTCLKCGHSFIAGK
jgi:hypothetical protein